MVFKNLCILTCALDKSSLSIGRVKRLACWYKDNPLFRRMNKTIHYLHLPGRRCELNNGNDSQQQLLDDPTWRQPFHAWRGAKQYVSHSNCFGKGCSIHKNRWGDQRKFWSRHKDGAKNMQDIFGHHRNASSIPHVTWHIHWYLSGKSIFCKLFRGFFIKVTLLSFNHFSSSRFIKI